MYFEIECKRLKMYVTKTYPSQQVESKFLKFDFYIELEFLKLEMLVSKHLLYPCKLTIFYSFTVLVCKYPRFRFVLFCV